jgi:hypothetical protein
MKSPTVSFDAGRSATGTGIRRTISTLLHRILLSALKCMFAEQVVAMSVHNQLAESPVFYRIWIKTVPECNCDMRLSDKKNNFREICNRDMLLSVILLELQTSHIAHTY